MGLRFRPFGDDNFVPVTWTLSKCLTYRVSMVPDGPRWLRVTGNQSSIPEREHEESREKAE